MTMRRDFLTITAGAGIGAVWGIVEPRYLRSCERRAANDAEPAPIPVLRPTTIRDEHEAALIAWLREHPPSHHVVLFHMLTRIKSGMHPVEVARRFQIELAGQTSPTVWRMVPTGPAEHRDSVTLRLVRT